IETDQTWDYFDECEARYRPIALTTAKDLGRQFFAIDGKLTAQTVIEDRAGRQSGGKREAREDMAGYSQTTDAMRTMRDVEGRLRHMDELGVDVQVLYPTVYLNQLTTKPQVDAALSRSYNRWLADIWRQGAGRLRWIAVPPLLNMPEAIEQLNWARDHGACGVFMRGFEDTRMLSDPYFFPLYEDAHLHPFRLRQSAVPRAGGRQRLLRRQAAGLQRLSPAHLRKHPCQVPDAALRL